MNKICALLFFSCGPQNFTYGTLLNYKLDDERCGGKYVLNLYSFNEKQIELRVQEISYCGENVQNYMNICENHEIYYS